MLKISDLCVDIWEKQILKNVSLDFEIGKTYFLLGKNGSGKSSLAYSIAGHPRYRIVSWMIEADSHDVRIQDVASKAKLWIFLSFQNVPEIRWIRLGEYLRTIYNISEKSKNPSHRDVSPFIFERFIDVYLKELQIPKEMLKRDLSVWFSGWEKRKIELLQMKLLNPKYIILDEIDSGLDVDAFKKVATFLQTIKNPNNTLIFITHNFNLMDFLDVDKVYVMDSWKVIDSWWKELVENIMQNWYCNYCKHEDPNCDLSTKCA